MPPLHSATHPASSATSHRLCPSQPAARGRAASERGPTLLTNLTPRQERHGYRATPIPRIISDLESSSARLYAGSKMVEAKAHAQTSTIVLRRHVIPTHVPLGNIGTGDAHFVKTSGDGHNVAGSGIGVFHDVREQFPNHRTDQLPRRRIQAIQAPPGIGHHRFAGYAERRCIPPASVNQASHGIRPSPRRYRPGTLP